MGIFGRKARSGAETAGAVDVFTAPERERIEALWRLTTLPRAEFEATYGAMLGGFWRYAASAQGEAWAALRRETLACVVAALRARQARMLPRFAAAEDAARLAEVMSFALAACVVAERFTAVVGRATAPGWRPLTDDVPETAALGGAPPPRPFGALLLARFAGEAGLGWLGQVPAALRALAAYFGDGPSELRAIAEEAERRIGVPLDRGPPVCAPAAPLAEEAAADRPDVAQPQAATAEPEPGPGRAPPPAIGGEGAGWEWINWVRAGLRDGSVPVNAAGAWLHNIAGEAYVVTPACFEAFRRRARARPGHGPQPRGPARAPPDARVALGRGQRLPRRARRREPRRGLSVSGGAHLGRRSAPPGERRAGPQGPVTGPCRARLRRLRAVAHLAHAALRRPRNRAACEPA